MRTNYAGAVGMYPIHPEAICINCKEKLSKKHGMNQNVERQSVMGWFMGGTGPRCIWCHKEAWTDREFWKRTGHSENSAARWQLLGNHRA